MSSISKPSGGRRDEMTTPPAAWPLTDEDLLKQQADSLRAVQSQLNGVHLTWSGKKTAIFNRNEWFGGASTAAEGRVGEHLQKMEALDRQIEAAVNFYDDAHKAIYDAKKKIALDTETAQKE